MMTRALGQRLSAIALESFLRSLQERTTRHEEHAGHDAANDRAVKALIVRQVSQHRISAATGQSELDRAFPETFLEFVQVEIEQGP